MHAVTPVLVLSVLLGGCVAAPVPSGAGPASTPAAPASAAASGAAPRRVILSIVGTNDLHGHIEKLPILGGYLANLRAARAADGGVVLVDAGDMFQGTLESNLVEGASVVAAYNLLGYAAAAIGNHEFDFGPAGERATPAGPGDDPRGALKARAVEARFPFLAANLLERGAGGPARRVDWPNAPASTMVEVAGVKVGIIGVTTVVTPNTTTATNFVGLAIAPLAATIAAEATRLRQAGAAVVIAAAHAGGTCGKFDRPEDPSSCKVDDIRGPHTAERDEMVEIVEVARALPAGLVDVIVAGHTHAGMAHVIAGIDVIESFSKGVAFGRVDLTLAGGKVVGRSIHPPQQLCPQAGSAPGPAAPCRPDPYEGRAVAPDAAVAELVTRYQAEAARLGDASLGVTLDRPIERAHGVESALGNLFADLMRTARPAADVALTNGGGLRADLPGGQLTYRGLYEAMPFDNRFAMVRLTGAELASLIADNLSRDNGILSVAGVRVKAACVAGSVRARLFREDGRPISPRQKLVVATSDFLAVGGDGLFGRLALPAGAIQIEEGPTIRDELAALLRKRGGTLRSDQLMDRQHPRLVYPGKRPMRCTPAPAGE